MQRCLQLAKLGAANVAPNPMVGAILVHNDEIIGEGFHERYGSAHAEVNCFNSVSASNKSLIPHSTLYVSLEPCAHFGKTPPCSDLIIEQRVPHVVIACSDPFSEVNGKGISKLEAAGIRVTQHILNEEALMLNKRFFTFHTNKRPWILLKWAETSDGFIAGKDYKRLAISNAYTNRFTHQFRNTESAILVGYKTALYDNPALTSRYGLHHQPLKIVLDEQLKLPATAELFSNTAPLIVINRLIEKQEDHIHYAKILDGMELLPFLMKLLYDKKIMSLIVEGGAFTLQSFIDAGLWDEALRIKNQQQIQLKGIAAPSLFNHQLLNEFSIESDLLSTFKNTNA